ncbi:hypothetical protein CJP72_10210 [Citrobacter sp. NCU1]|uniref:hypothetical protein n=1 Tax=Citrobacter sp. NCU1 TaxID=2026683 RepID=UPI00139094D8|nr:hypothetical protein [Citrobacter sp. NCU1]NDO81124.1 hypothetical protein [Citrobacter sp. NCU1]
MADRKKHSAHLICALLLMAGTCNAGATTVFAQTETVTGHAPVVETPVIKLTGGPGHWRLESTPVQWRDEDGDSFGEGNHGVQYEWQIYRNDGTKKTVFSTPENYLDVPAENEGMDIALLIGVFTDNKTTESANGYSPETATVHIPGVENFPDENKTEVALTTNEVVIGSGAGVQVRLKDKNGNKIEGQCSLLGKQIKVNVPAAEPYSEWREEFPGTSYSSCTRYYNMMKIGNNLKISLSSPQWKETHFSEGYSVRSPYITKITTSDGWYFYPEEGFPHTGIKGKQFTLEFWDGNPADYDWSDNSDAVDVNNGTVTFTTNTPPANRTITITGTPHHKEWDVVTYTFTLHKWFTEAGNGQKYTWKDAVNQCALMSDVFPEKDQLDLEGWYIRTASSDSFWTATKGTFNHTYTVKGYGFPDWGGSMNENDKNGVLCLHEYSH